MLKNYFTIAFRNLYRNKVYSFINIAGLAIGIATCILLTLWATDELSFDRFHRNADSIYRVISNFDNEGRRVILETTPAPTGPFGKAEVPGIEEAVRVLLDWTAVRKDVDESTIMTGIRDAYVDSSFFQFFDFELVYGDPENPFPDAHSVILIQSLAERIFGSEDPMGKSLIIKEREEFLVSGIMKDIPHNSSIQFEMVRPIDYLVQTYQPNRYWSSLETDWGNYKYSTYILLHENTSPAEVAQQLTTIHGKNQQESLVMYTLQPFSKMHLYGADLSEQGIQIVRIFLVIAIIILLIACINYINLTTAHATERSREVGIRKTTGADRKTLIGQFLIESGLIAGISLALALIIIKLVIPTFNETSGKELQFEILDTGNMILLGSALFLTWLIAGSYPAVLLSSFKPIRAMKGEGLIGRNTLFRKALVVTQFTLSIGIIAGTLVIQNQMRFIQQKNLGFEKENIFTFWMRGEMEAQRETIITELEKHPGIARVSMANQRIWQVDNTTGDTDWDGKNPNTDFMIKPVNVDKNFMETLGLELAEGRWFSGRSTDTAAFILNETAAQSAGIENPVGKSFTLWDRKGTIIGVVKDFHHTSLRQKIEPTIFFHNPTWFSLLYVKVNGHDTPGAIEATEKLWKEFNPKWPFNYTFIDADYDYLYRSEQRTAKIFIGFSILAIIISCLGLFGLATFTAAQRTKEIGIRKVLGATVNQIVILLSKDFAKLVLIAFVISIPIAWYAMQQWLQDFAYSIDIEWWMFAVAGILAFIIANLTIGFQSVKAALMNPVDSLKEE